MQSIEPKDAAIDKAFPSFHPQWVQRSQDSLVTPESFMLARVGLRISIEQCAVYMRVSAKTVRCWENGTHPVPFFAYELLRLIQESKDFKFSHPDWNGWFVSKDGVLVSPDVGGNGIKPEHLNYYLACGTEANQLKGEIATLKQQLAKAQDENTKLREMFLSLGVVDELYSMHDRLSLLVKQMATAHIVPFKRDDAESSAARLPMVKVA